MKTVLQISEEVTLRVKDKKVKNSKADKLLEGVLRPNCILDVKADKKVPNG